METVKEFFNGLFESTSERVKSVFLGTYSILFLVWNWQLFAILLFSTKSIEEKIQVVKLDYSAWPVFVAPLILTIIYVFGMPWLNLWVDTGLKKSNEKLFDRKVEKRNKKLTQKVKEASLEYEIATNKAGTNEIERLKSEVEGANVSRDKARELNKELQKKYDDLQRQYSAQETLLNNLRLDIDHNMSFRDITTNKENLFNAVSNNLINGMTIEEKKDFKNIAKEITINRFSNNINSNQSISSKAIKFINKGLIEIKNENNKEYFTVTELGTQVYKLLTGKYLD